VELVIERKGKRSLKSFACWNWRRKVRGLVESFIFIENGKNLETIG
jgi:hypothetical protein